MGFGNRNIHTVYDRMEAKGVFDANPANNTARDPITGEATYKGPVAFPKMLYHPKGETRAYVAASPGQKEQREIINRTVQNEDEFRELTKKGWHEHPADALRAGGMHEDELPAKGSVDRVGQLEKLLAAQTAELAKLRGSKLQNDAPEDED